MAKPAQLWNASLPVQSPCTEGQPVPVVPRMFGDGPVSWSTPPDLDVAERLYGGRRPSRLLGVKSARYSAYFSAVGGIHPWATANWPIRRAISLARLPASAVSLVRRVSAPSWVAPVST